VSAARNFEFVFKERTPDSITITAMGVEECYDLLCILDFNNVRKRMSVVVQNKIDDKILLLCKGAGELIAWRKSCMFDLAVILLAADSIIYERLEVGSQDIKSRTQEHLNVSSGKRCQR
jgi:phospholipid-translocating ATPase